jgi:hypothetical protein
MESLKERPASSHLLERHRDHLGFVSQNSQRALRRESFGIVSARPQELTFFLLPLSQAYPWASTVLVDELDAGCF